MQAVRLEGLRSSFWHDFAFIGFQNHAPKRGREAVFQNKWQKIGRRGCVKHERHKENNKLHKKFTKLQVLCIPSFLQTGLGGESCTGVELQAVFEGGMERAHSEPNEQLNNKSGQK